ncbi:Zinc finger, RING-type [Dillenia turbinata]|uniref:RING-type E3 ubiquitin transferase n=1 Tax=Dillenia turbinata TaxID=194707 RepID=A0AAN8ZNH1_9MAGN
MEEEDQVRVSQANNSSTCSSPSQQNTTSDVHGNRDNFEDYDASQCDGLFCPICMHAWTADGDHYLCSLPCGHLYGMSCVKRWLELCGKNFGKCPQCNIKYKMKEIRKIYASRVVVADEDFNKKLQVAETKCTLLVEKEADWHRKEEEWHKRENALCLELHQLKERTKEMEQLLQNRRSVVEGYMVPPSFPVGGSSHHFLLQKELQLEGARLFDIDASGQTLIIARRLSGLGGEHFLSKISLIPPYESQNIFLPPNTKACRDLRVAPSFARLALLATLGKKMSILSLESNNVVLAYDLPAAAWSCSWDLNNPHNVYAGLQNGMLFLFDMRQTGRPVESMTGLACNPVHNIHSVIRNPSSPGGVNTLLSASAIGLCQWNFGAVEERQSQVPETENHGVCISSAYSPSNDDIVASFRPKVEMLNEMAFSQPNLTPIPTGLGQGVQGSHVHLKRVGNKYYQWGFSQANVNHIRLPKSLIIERKNERPLFASGDEFTGELVLQDLPSLAVVQRLQPSPFSPISPVLDVKHTNAWSPSFLCCLREDKLQLFSAKPLP